VLVDFSVVEPAPELCGISRSGRRPRVDRDREVSLVRESPSGRLSAQSRRRDDEEQSSSVAREQPEPRDWSPEPSHSARALRTEERRMIAAVKRNQRFLIVVSVLALLGALCFGAAIWQLHQRRAHPPTFPVAKRVVKPVVQTPRPAPPPPQPVVVTPEPAPAPPIRWDAPPTRRYAGFLTVRANVPSIVFIDGARVRAHTPLHRYPVRPGRRHVVLEAIATGDRQEFTVAIRRGRSRMVQALDLKGAPR
jgi:hypothetical protein